MSNVWQQKDDKKFAKWIKQQGLGTTVYTVERAERRVAPYEDAGLYVAHTFTWRHPLLGDLMTGHMSARSLCAGFGPVYTSPPPGTRALAGPVPQVAGPLDGDTRILDRDELTHLTKLGREARQGQREAGRRRWL